jgi:hypothetical protein
MVGPKTLTRFFNAEFSSAGGRVDVLGKADASTSGTNSPIGLILSWRWLMTCHGLLRWRRMPCVIPAHAPSLCWLANTLNNSTKASESLLAGRSKELENPMGRK